MGSVKIEADLAPTHVTRNRAHHEWSLYWRDRNHKFHLDDRIDPTPQVQVLLDYVGSREDAVFWG